PAEAPAPRADVGPRSRKHERLLQIATSLEGSNEQYFGSGRRRALEAVDPSTLEAEERAAHEFALAWEYFKLDEPARAESLFASAATYASGPRPDYFLAVTQLRMGERENCIVNHNAESCVFPIAGRGIYRERSGTERALATLTDAIGHAPLAVRPQFRWLINLASMALGRWPGDLPPTVLIPPESFASPYDVGRFRDIGPDVGVSPLNLAGGSAMDDFDGDGLLDLVTSTADLRGQLLYYRNNGDGTFEDRTEAAGLVGQLGGLNLTHADYDGDGDQDLLVLRGGWMGTWGRIPNSLLRNRGDGTFVDVTAEAGLGPDYPTQTAAFADYDLDGDLDLFVGTETPPPASNMEWPCQLFRNEGDGTFVDVAKAAGVENFRLAKGCAWGDYDDDGDPDLYVSNQFDHNRLYRNGGDGTFTDVAPALGVDEPTFSFPVWFWDYDNDGRLDLFVAGYGGNMATLVRSYLKPDRKFGHNALYRNEGGTFRDLSDKAGLRLQTLAMGANFGDLDNDGWLDFYLGTGTPAFDDLMPDVMYRNAGGVAFQDVTQSGGFGNLQKGHGIAWGDVDNDGDQDIYLQSGGIYRYDAYYNSLFLNPGHGNRWVTLLLEGSGGNRDALGARVRVRVRENGRERSLYRWVWPSGSFGSSSRQQEIGLGRADEILSVEVKWPGRGATQEYDGIEPGAFYRLREGAAAPERMESRRVPLGG
ncbi:CRTAC1 family protein, partial [bacterium]|nr:CRTAC1 family protein [bacterium]